MQPQQFIAALPLLLMVSVALVGADNTITEYSAPSGTPTTVPPAPFTEAQFAYQYFTPTASDPQRNNLHYRLFTPPSYSTSGSAKHPLVFFLHGDGEKENGTIRNQAQMRDNGQYAFCTTGSQGILPCFFALVQTSWYARDGGTQTAVDLTAALCAKYRIDPDRVFVTGLSGGGGATLSWAGRQPGNWAGFVALSAPAPGEAGAYQPGNLATIPSWFFAANDDTTVGPGNQTGQMIDLRSRGGRPIYTLYNNGGHSKNTWGSAYGTKALITWMAGLRRGQPAQQPVEVAITSPTANTTLVSAATTTGLAGTTLDRQLSGASSGLTSVSWFTGTNSPQAAGGSIASWSSTANQNLAAGNTYVVATASGTSFDSARGGITTYCDVMLVNRSAGTNTAPVAHAGTDVAITLPASAALSGSATDDGLPSGSASTYAWSKVSGPGTVTFTAGTSAATGAGFSAAGTYVLRLTASDGSLSGTDDVTITVSSVTPVNTAPVAHAGADATVTLPASAPLSGSATDDGLPSGSMLSYVWSKVSGSGTVTFTASTSAASGASFSAAGSYVLRLTVSDGALSGMDEMTVTVATAPVANSASADSAATHGASDGGQGGSCGLGGGGIALVSLGLLGLRVRRRDRF